MNKVTTLNQFIVEEQAKYEYATGNFSRLLHHVGIAAKKVNREVNKAGLIDILGRADSENIQGEEQQKLDLYADSTFLDELSASGECCAVISEEREGIVFFEEAIHQNAKYLFCMDPLDGSSNIDVNVSIGTVFSIYKRITPIGSEVTEADFLQCGDKQVAAGYIIYGSSTMLVYTAGNGVNGFTLDPSIGEFCLSHPMIMTPSSGTIYSVNEGNYINFPDGVKQYIKYCQEKDEATSRPYTSRYIGSLVADIHRNLLKGGIFIYPPTNRHSEGKLRLMYECNPVAFIAEQAGGLASSGSERILAITPNSLHQRSALYTGSSKMVQRVIEFLG